MFKLYLEDNDIREVDAKKLAKSIYRLNLGGNPLTAKKVAELQEALGERFVYTAERDAYTDKSFWEDATPAIELAE
jgi:hypothetical protein